MGWLNEFRKKIAENKGGAESDINGQPLTQAFRSDAIVDRQIDELIGIIKGVMADGIVHQGEVEFLIEWMNANRKARDKWPAKAIYPRLVAALEDGNMDLNEEREIMNLLLAAVGGNTAPQYGEASNSTALPYTVPAPIIVFNESLFCFTGKFQSGSRQWCESQIIAKGGVPAANVTKKLIYLVIGEIGSRDWLHSRQLRKAHAGAIRRSVRSLPRRQLRKAPPGRPRTQQGSLPRWQLRKASISPRISTASSLPHRQLRNDGQRGMLFQDRSLPRRQLRNSAVSALIKPQCSLPCRQLRNEGDGRYRD